MLEYIVSSSIIESGTKTIEQVGTIGNLVDAAKMLDKDAWDKYGVHLGAKRYCLDEQKEMSAGDFVEFARRLDFNREIVYRISALTASIGCDDSYKEFFVDAEGRTHGDCYISECAMDRIFIAACTSIDGKFTSSVSSDEGDMFFFERGFDSATDALAAGYAFMAKSPDLLLRYSQKVPAGEFLVEQETPDESLQTDADDITSQEPVSEAD